MHNGRIGQFFAALTVRGRCLLAAGVAALLPGFVLHEINVTRVGVFLLALPIVSYVMVARTRYRLTCSRRLDPVLSSLKKQSQAVFRVRVPFLGLETDVMKSRFLEFSFEPDPRMMGPIPHNHAEPRPHRVKRFRFRQIHNLNPRCRWRFRLHFTGR